MKKEKMFDVVIGVNWSVPARTAEEAIKKAQIVVSQKGFGYRPSCCTAEVEKSPSYGMGKKELPKYEATAEHFMES